MSDTNIKDIVLNTDCPIVLKNFQLSWKCFSLSIGEWCKLFDSEHPNGVKCDLGDLKHNQYPQWERNRKSATLTMSSILDDSYRERTDLKNTWASYSYKDINELPSVCRDGINFGELGFGMVEDISFWLGSNGAHTPCHYDSHGCNIVVQIYGRKSWLLFPPEAPLNPTRVPYEETSVYCKENFFSPMDWTQFESKVYFFILKLIL